MFDCDVGFAKLFGTEIPPSLRLFPQKHAQGTSPEAARTVAVSTLVMFEAVHLLSMPAICCRRPGRIRRCTATLMSR
jgi:hypothetical protein